MCFSLVLKICVNGNWQVTCNKKGDIHIVDILVREVKSSDSFFSKFLIT